MSTVLIAAIVAWIVSIVLAVVDNGWRNPLLWAVWSLNILALFKGLL